MKNQPRDPKTPVKTIFCANEQVDTLHELSASPSGEIQATCVICGRVLKFPAGITPEEFDSLVESHKTSNIGQVTVESINKQLHTLSDQLKTVDSDESEENQVEKITPNTIGETGIQSDGQPEL